MDDLFNDKVKAGAKIAVGVARVASSLALATGHGLLGGFFKSHHMMNQAVKLAKVGMDGGLKQIDEGIERWKKS